jgi:hypothetical protein
MAQSIYKLVDDLPAKSMTTRMLGALDWVVPGEWKNIVGFENTIRAVTGETDQTRIQRIGERAIHLFNDKSQGYQSAVWLYQTVDSVQKLGGMAAFTNKLSTSFGFLKFLGRITPKSDTTQAVDFGIKTVTEIVAFCKINGIPGDSVGQFVESLADYRHEALMRMAALISVDGLLPLGPEFLDKTLSLLDKTGAGALEGNAAFQKIRSMIPGGNTADQMKFIQKGVGETKNWMGSFVQKHGLTPDKIVSNLRGKISGLDGKLDYVAAVIDMSTNYYEHTGVQSVARSLISRAAAEI